MLVQFVVGNFRSFKGPSVFSTVAANLTAQDKSLDANNVFQAAASLKLLKSIAVYGANASGKSNLIKALLFMRSFILNSSRDSQAEDEIPVDGFKLCEEMKGLPSHFEITFIADSIRYRYGFEVDTKAVHAEWLYHTPSSRETKLFIREGARFDISKTFIEGAQLTEKTRSNALFLSVAAQFNGAIAQRILRWFRSVIIAFGVNDQEYRHLGQIDLEDDNIRTDIIRLVKQLDVGIQDASIEKRPANFAEFFNEDFIKKLGTISDKDTISILNTMHRYYKQNQPLEQLAIFEAESHESEGTKKLFFIAGRIIRTLRQQSILIIDELDARLHPLLTMHIVKLFNSRAGNPNNSQLIFTTHDTNLLSKNIFRRDQIWFTEKDRFGATHLFSLAEYKIRNDASFEKDYIAGKYGAIPFVGDIEHIIGVHDA